MDVLAQAAAAPFLGGVESAVRREEVEERIRKAERTREPVDAVTAWQLQTSTVPAGELPSVVASVWAKLRAITDGEGHPLEFDNAGVHLVRRSPQLVHRTQMTSFWLRLSHDPVFASGNLTQVAAAHAADQLVFASAKGLYDGTLLLDAYLGPLLGALTPSIWAFPGVREEGTIVFSLGQPLAGTSGDASELLHLLPVPGATRVSPVPHLSPTAASVAMSWWAQRLDEMFAVLTDPTVFADAQGRYRVETHLQALLTVEQLFRRVTSTQTVHRDANARRVLLFTVLDTLDRLTGHHIEEMCSLQRAAATLERTRSRIPSAAAAVLLPAAEHAVAALEELQDGFFISRQAGVDRVELTGTNDPQTLSMDDATARYVKLLRDATHGHGSNRRQKMDRTNALLAQHTGDIPHELGLLGYLYLLELLVEPQRLAEVLYRAGLRG